MSSRSTAVLYLCSDAFAECIYIFSAFLSLFICLTPLQILVFCFRVWWSLHEIMAIKTSLTVLQCRSNVTSRWPRVTVAKALHCAYHELSPLGSSVLQSGSYSVFTFSPAADSISTSVCLSVSLLILSVLQVVITCSHFVQLHRHELSVFLPCLPEVAVTQDFSVILSIGSLPSLSLCPSVPLHRPSARFLGCALLSGSLLVPRCSAFCFPQLYLWGLNHFLSRIYVDRTFEGALFGLWLFFFPVKVPFSGIQDSVHLSG